MNTLILGLAVVVAAPAPKDNKKPESPTILGDWSLESMTFMGMPLPKKDEHLSLTFSKDGTVTAYEGLKAKPEVSKFTHDAKTEPPQLDLEEKGGMKVSAIYKIEGDLLTICMAVMGERPKKFDSDGGAILMTFKRMKKD